MLDKEYNRLAATLLEWQRFSKLPLKRQDKTLPSWDAAHELVRRARDLDDYARQHLEEALIQSDRKLAPLCDPLRLCTSDNRWLCRDREESYSDWLAWILSCCRSTDILGLFGAGAFEASQLESVEREHRNEDGRTDIQVWFENPPALLLIEVKINPPSEALSEQLNRYQRQAKREALDIGVQPEHIFLILLTADECVLDSNPEWRSVSWATVCTPLRRLTKSMLNGGLKLMRAAAILNFCGAVEQNLLAVSAHPQRIRAMESVDYINSWDDDYETHTLGG